MCSDGSDGVSLRFTLTCPDGLSRSAVEQKLSQFYLFSSNCSKSGRLLKRSVLSALKVQFLSLIVLTYIFLMFFFSI